MPVAHVTYRTQTVGPRQLYAPKEASDRGWWNEVRKAFRELELAPWGLVKGRMVFKPTEDTITFEGPGTWVMIARRRDMR